LTSSSSAESSSVDMSYSLNAASGDALPEAALAGSISEAALRRSNPEQTTGYNPIHNIDDHEGDDDVGDDDSLIKVENLKVAVTPVASGKTNSEQDEFQAVLRSLVIPIFIPALAQTIALSLSIPVLPLFILGDLHGSTSDVGMVLATQGAGRMLANIPAGHYMSIVGDKSIICGGLFLNVIASIFMGLSPNVGFLIVAEIVMGSAFACYFQGRMSYLKEAVVVSMRGRAMALLGGVYRIGSVVGPFLGGLIAAKLSIRTALLAQAVFAMIALVLTLRFLPTTLSNASAPTERGSIEMVAPVTSADDESSIRSDTGANKTSTLISVWKEHWPILTSVAFYGCLLFIIRTARDMLLPLVSHRCGLGAYGTGAVTSASYVADTGVFYLAGVLMDTFGRKCNGILSPFGFLVGFVLLGTVLRENHASPPVPREDELPKQLLANRVASSADDGDGLLGGSGSVESTVWSLYIAGAVLGVASGLGSGLVMTLGSDLAPPDAASRGLFLGLFRVFTDAGILLGSVLVGVVADIMSLGAACNVAAVFSAVAAAQIFSCVKETLPENSRTSVLDVIAKARARVGQAIERLRSS